MKIEIKNYKMKKKIMSKKIIKIELEVLIILKIKKNINIYQIMMIQKILYQIQLKKKKEK